MDEITWNCSPTDIPGQGSSHKEVFGLESMELPLASVWPFYFCFRSSLEAPDRFRKL